MEQLPPFLFIVGDLEWNHCLDPAALPNILPKLPLYLWAGHDDNLWRLSDALMEGV